MCGVALFRHDSPELFGTFSHSFITMLRISAGRESDSFSNVQIDGSLTFAPAIFSVTYFIIVQWILFQASLTVVMNNYGDSVVLADKELKCSVLGEIKGIERIQNPLEPLLLKLTKGYVDGSDLVDKLEKIFQVNFA